MRTASDVHGKGNRVTGGKLNRLYMGNFFDLRSQK